MDNTLKILLGVLGFAGVLTFLATTLNIPNTPEVPAAVVDATAKPTLPPPPGANEPGEEKPEEEEVVVDEDDVAKEELESFGEPTIELPGDEEEARQSPAFNENQSSESYDPSNGPPPPPPPGAI